MASETYMVLSDKTHFVGDTGAGLMRNRCAFTSRDMGQGWADAFTYAVVFGWDEGLQQVAERWRWDDALVEFLIDAHERFEALPDKEASDGS